MAFNGHFSSHYPFSPSSLVTSPTESTGNIPSSMAPNNMQQQHRSTFSRPETPSRSTSLMSLPDSATDIQPTQPLSTNDLDRQMVRHLISTYSQDQLMSLLREEGARISYNDQASTNSSHPSSSAFSHSFVTSDDQSSSTYDGASSAFSDTNSMTGSVFSNISTSLPSRNRHTRLSPVATNGNESSTATPSATTPRSRSSTKQKPSFLCGFCKEDDIVKTCTRKNDLKRHIEDFHSTNAQWMCQSPGCGLIFDGQTAYKAHLKQSHGGARLPIDDARIELCPQLVFACGYETCQQIYEATHEADTSALFKEFVSHIIKHFDDVVPDWTYDTRMQNLLRQSQIQCVWFRLGWTEESMRNLHWDPSSSSILRKRLECRHVDDPTYILQHAVELGSSPTTAVFRPGFIVPRRDRCKFCHYGGANFPLQHPSTSPSNTSLTTNNTISTQTPQTMSPISLPPNASQTQIPAHLQQQQQQQQQQQKRQQKLKQLQQSGQQMTFSTPQDSPSFRISRRQKTIQVNPNTTSSNLSSGGIVSHSNSNTQGDHNLSSSNPALANFYASQRRTFPTQDRDPSSLALATGHLHDPSVLNNLHDSTSTQPEDRSASANNIDPSVYFTSVTGNATVVSGNSMTAASHQNVHLYPASSSHNPASTMVAGAENDLLLPHMTHHGDVSLADFVGGASNLVGREDVDMEGTEPHAHPNYTASLDFSDAAYGTHPSDITSSFLGDLQSNNPF